MKRCALLLLTIFVILFGALGCHTSEPNVNAQSMDNSQTRTYEVFGMDCPGCHGGLEKLVKKIPSVQNAQANWEKKQLMVTVRPQAQLNDEDIYDAVRRANFTPGKRIN